MTALVFAAFIALIFFLELSHRREREELYKLFCKGSAPSSRTRHISPHRKTLDEKRRINK